MATVSTAYPLPATTEAQRRESHEAPWGATWEGGMQ
jgi:hypothetical protein